MPILNFGSINIDYIYRMDKFVRPGETKHCQSLIINAGGKGLNQSIAAARAGTTVWHAAIVGRDGGFLVEKLAKSGVDTSLMHPSEELSGHAIIQVENSGQNCIILYGGTNQLLTEEYILHVLESFGDDGLVLLQNETNLVPFIIRQAHARGIKVALNAAPYSDALRAYPLELLDWLIVNEVEGSEIAQVGSTDEILPHLSQRFPHCGILLTLGKIGAWCQIEGQIYRIGSFPVQVVDTTAAGDTFTGYFLQGILEGLPVNECLRVATAAAALCVQKLGAADSIPLMSEVQQALNSGSLGTLA